MIFGSHLIRVNSNSPLESEDQCGDCNGTRTDIRYDTLRCIGLPYLTMVRAGSRATVGGIALRSRRVLRSDSFA